MCASRLQSRFYVLLPKLNVARSDFGIFSSVSSGMIYTGILFRTSCYDSSASFPPAPRDKSINFMCVFFLLSRFWRFAPMSFLDFHRKSRPTCWASLGCWEITNTRTWWSSLEQPWRWRGGLIRWERYLYSAYNTKITPQDGWAHHSSSYK